MPALRPSLEAFFSASARRYSSRPALFVRGRTWSYSELDAQCTSLENALRAVGIVGAQANVGVIYARSAFTYAAPLAIMRTNSVYVPLNPKLPAERMLRIFADAAIEALIIDTSDGLTEGVIGALEQSANLRIISRDRDPDASLEAMLKTAHQHKFCYAAEAAHIPIQPQDAASLPATNLAYIIYTSGSTGVPKGVAITHESACSCIEKSHHLFDTCEQDRFTQFSALSFDVSILDLFLCWKSGAALYVPESTEALLPLNFTVANEITVWSSVPSLSNVMHKLRLLQGNVLPKVRLSLFCGEALPAQLARAWAEAAPRSRVFNLYGPTECTIFATRHEYDVRNASPDGTVPIGIPLPAMSCRIVDEGRVIEAEAIPGELWISGDQLAVGYWNNRAATDAAFVHLAHDAEMRRWYRTGDLVSRDADARLTYRGRLDRQVKLLGHRIELQEVESIVRAVTGCTLVAVIPVRGTGGICEKLIAYCDELNDDEVAIRKRCLDRMPRYMVPERILELDSFPFSAHGKVDYSALAARPVTLGVG
jgi:amino acid adenylation domain-containing protein